jgi:hypothetical protein
MAAAQAESVAMTVAPRDRELLVAAAWLHDIGYADALRDTGFHPLDGASYLLAVGAPLRLAALVAHHSEAALLAPHYGLESRLAEFPSEEGSVTDALVYADMTAGPTGKRMCVSDRLADIRVRHATEDPLLFIGRRNREPLIMAAVARVLQRRDSHRWTEPLVCGQMQNATRRWQESEDCAVVPVIGHRHTISPRTRTTPTE